MPNRTAIGELPERRTEGLQRRYGVVLNVPSIGPEDVHAKQHAATDAVEKRHGERHSQEHVELTTILLTSRAAGRLRLSHIVYIAN